MNNYNAGMNKSVINQISKIHTIIGPYNSPNNELITNRINNINVIPPNNTPLTLLQFRKKQAQNKKNHTTGFWTKKVSPNNTPLTLLQFRRKQAQNKIDHTTSFWKKTVGGNYSKRIKRRSRRRNP